MKQTMFESLVEEFPNQEQQLNIIFRKLGLDKSFPNPDYAIRQSGKSIKQHIKIFVRMFLLKKGWANCFYSPFINVGRSEADLKHFGQMLEKLYTKEILDKCIKRTRYGFEIIKDFDREVKE